MSPPPPTKYGVALFSGFQLLDVCGPLDMINLLSTLHNQATLYILAESLEPVPTNPGKPCNQLMVPTHTFSTCPQDIEVLLIPGGMGCRTDQIIASAVEFVKNIYPKLRYLMTVCTGTVIVARSGVLDGRRATSNKAAFRWVLNHGDYLIKPILRSLSFAGGTAGAERQVGARGALGGRRQHLHELGRECWHGSYVRFHCGDARRRGCRLSRHKKRVHSSKGF